MGQTGAEGISNFSIKFVAQHIHQKYFPDPNVSSNKVLWPLKFFIKTFKKGARYIDQHQIIPYVLKDSRAFGSTF